jgi:hypothetical protein
MPVRQWWPENTLMLSLFGTCASLRHSFIGHERYRRLWYRFLFLFLPRGASKSQAEWYAIRPQPLWQIAVVFMSTSVPIAYGQCVW